MSSPDFESITSGVFQPHVGRWYELELDENYPHIEPNSALGRMGVELNQRLNEATATRYTLGDYCEETVRQAMDIEWERTDLRVGVYEGMYFDIASVLEHDAANYEGAVAGAFKRGINELDDPEIPQDMRANLARLTQEFVLFLDLEDELHFRDLV